MSETRTAGRELDALIAEKVMGESLVVPRERALAMLGAHYTVATGSVFVVKVGEHEVRVPMPSGEELGGWEGDDNWNQRYFRHVALHLLDFPNEIGERVARDLASIRGTPKHYSTEIAAAWDVHLAMCDRPFSVRQRYFAAMQERARELFGVNVAWPDVLVVLRGCFSETICLAALAALPSTPEADQ